HTRSDRDWSSDVCSSDLSNGSIMRWLKNELFSRNVPCKLRKTNPEVMNQSQSSNPPAGESRRSFIRKTAGVAATVATANLLKTRSEEHTSELQSRSDLVC